MEQRRDFKLKHCKIDSIIKAMESAKRNSKNIMLSGAVGCVDCDTEYFNGKKWVKISEYQEGDLVLEYNNKTENGILSYPLKYIKEPCDKMYHLHSMYGIDQVVSPEHQLAYLTSKNNFHKQIAEEYVERYNKSTRGIDSSRFITTFKYDGKGIDLTDAEIKIMLAVIADGTLCKKQCRFHVKKDRKKEELRKIFKEANIEYREQSSSAEGYTDFYIYPPILTKNFPENWYDCSNKQLQIICDNVLKWDGSITNNRKRFTTTIKEHADFVQFAFTACGYRAKISTNDRRGRVRVINSVDYTTHSIEYNVQITDKKFPALAGCQKNHIDVIKPKDGYKYCFTMPTSNLILRRNGNIFITGNCGKTTICSQIADKLALNFYPYSLCQHTTKSDLVGFIDASGNYRTSALREAFEHGGLVLLDEMDAANPNVLSIVNNMLSNGQFYFPDGLVEKHDDFKCICAMNSNGRGNEIIYTKSQRLDASTLDRFIFIKIDIDEDLERTLTDNEDWYNRVIKFRQVVKEVCNDEIVIGSRAMLDGADLLENGFSQSEVEDMVIYKGIDEDIVEAIKAKMDVKSEQVLSRQIPSDVKNTDGIYILTNDNGEESAWLDKEYIDKQDPKLLEIIKSGLGLH